MREDIIRMALEAGIVVTGEAVWKLCELVAAAERNKVASWMMAKGYATGHGDTTEDLLRELEWQVADRCAKIAYEAEPWHSADLIREAFGVKK
jgi:hypothetical protein